jgi:hypothetical protein
MSDVSRLRRCRSNPNQDDPAKTEQLIKMAPSYTMSSGVATSGWIIQFEIVSYNRGFALHRPGPLRGPSVSSLYTGLGHAVFYVKFLNGEIHDLSWNSDGLLYDRYPSDRTTPGKFGEVKAVRFCPELACAGFVLRGQSLPQPFHVAALWGAAVSHDATVNHRMCNYKIGTNCLAFCLNMEDFLLSGTTIEPSHGRHQCHATEWSTRGAADMCENPLCESRSAADAAAAAPQPLAFSYLAQQLRPSSTNITLPRLPWRVQRMVLAAMPWYNTRSRTLKRGRGQELEGRRLEAPKLQDQEATSCSALTNNVAGLVKEYRRSSRFAPTAVAAVSASDAEEWDAPGNVRRSGRIALMTEITY